MQTKELVAVETRALLVACFQDEVRCLCGSAFFLQGTSLPKHLGLSSGDSGKNNPAVLVAEIAAWGKCICWEKDLLGLSHPLLQNLEEPGR